MQKTTNYGFPKPEDDDFFNVKDFADMMDKVDETLAKVENAGGIYVGGTNLSTEATINDEEAEYPVLSKNASSISETMLFSKSLALKIGTYSVMIRNCIDSSKVSEILFSSSLFHTTMLSESCLINDLSAFDIPPLYS